MKPKLLSRQIEDCFIVLSDSTWATAYRMKFQLTSYRYFVENELHKAVSTMRRCFLNELVQIFPSRRIRILSFHFSRVYGLRIHQTQASFSPERKLCDRHGSKLYFLPSKTSSMYSLVLPSLPSDGMTDSVNLSKQVLRQSGG